MKTLLEHFYRIHTVEQIEPSAWKVNVALNPDHPVYEGHFPGHPVVPGVCMLQIISECASERLGRSLRYKRLDSCKFLSVINPLQTPMLCFSLSLKEQEGVWQFAAEGVANETPFIKLKGTVISR